jgi:hypothetical protein
MPRTKGSKNKNINTAKNKNVININVGSSVSKKGRGRPRKQNANSNAQTRYPNYGGGNANAPPQVIISQPQPDNNSSALSSFIASRFLNESMNSNKSNLLSVEPTLREQPSYFNARESIIPKLSETPRKEMMQEIKPPVQQQTIKQDVKPPPPPPPPPAQKQPAAQKPNLSSLSGMDAIVAELKYANTEEGKAEKARKKAERESKKTASQQSTTDFLNMSFTPPKKDIVEMMTPAKETKSTAIVPYKENKSFLDFVVGGTPQKLKTPKQHLEKEKERLKELSKIDKKSVKETFEFNKIKSQFTDQPNPNKDIAKSILTDAIKAKKARKEMQDLVTKKAASTITKAIKNKIAKKDFYDAVVNFEPSQYQEKIRKNRKDFTRVISDTKKTEKERNKAQLQLKKTDDVFVRKSNAGRPKTYDGQKQTEL